MTDYAHNITTCTPTDFQAFLRSYLVNELSYWNRWGRGGHCTPNFDKSVDPISTRGTDYAPHIFSGLPTVLLSKRAELIGKIEFDDEPNRTAKVG